MKSKRNVALRIRFKKLWSHTFVSVRNMGMTLRLQWERKRKFTGWKLN